MYRLESWSKPLSSVARSMPGGPPDRSKSAPSRIDATVLAGGVPPIGRPRLVPSNRPHVRAVYAHWRGEWQTHRPEFFLHESGQQGGCVDLPDKSPHSVPSKQAALRQYRRGGLDWRRKSLVWYASLRSARAYVGPNGVRPWMERRSPLCS